jgi:acetyltransferase
VNEVDLLEYFLEDPQTEIIFLYLEGFSKARKLFELACSSTKPIIVLKSNIAPISHEIARSHTTALASDDKVVDAAFKQAGIIRIQSIDEIFNCVKVLLLPPLKGQRLASMSGGGGASVIIADECHRNGFTLPPLPQTFLDWLQNKGRAGIITLTNPLDLGDIYDLDVHIQIIEKLQDLSEIDGIFYNLYYSKAWDEISTLQKKLFDYCSEVNRHSKKPVIIRLDLDTPNAWAKVKEKFPKSFLESISGAFLAMRKVLEARKVKPTSLPVVDKNIDANGKIASILKSASQQGKGFLDYEGYNTILEELGISIVKSNYFSKEEVERIRRIKLQFPVVLKAIGDDLIHKTEVGGVRLDVKNKNELSEALTIMTSDDRLSSAMGFLIQEMISHGIEIIVGGKRDPQFGPVVMVGLGGILVELFSDIHLALAPIDLDMARRMVESLKGYPLLKGYRGTVPADVNAVCKILKRVSDLMVLFPGVSEIDLNPIKVLDQGGGSVVIDCKVFLDLSPGL